MIYCTKRRTAADFLDSFVFLMKLSNGTVTVCLFYGEKIKELEFLFLKKQQQQEKHFKSGFKCICIAETVTFPKC